MTHAMRKLGGVLFAAVSALAITASATTANAESLRDNWCKDVHLRFFVGGAEGDAFASIVYNGALQAAKDTGAQVDYVFSGWKAETMVQQLREAVAAKPDGIAMMGHPGEASIMPLAEEASKAGIKMMYQNVAASERRRQVRWRLRRRAARAAGHGARRGSGPPLRPQVGRHRRSSFGPFDQQPERYVREGATADGTSKTAGLKVIPHPLTDRVGGRSEPRHFGRHRCARPTIRTIKAIIYPGGQLLGNAAGLHAGGRQEAGRGHQYRVRHQPADRRWPSRTAGCSLPLTSSRSSRATCRS